MDIRNSLGLSETGGEIYDGGEPSTTCYNELESPPAEVKVGAAGPRLMDLATGWV